MLGACVTPAFAQTTALSGLEGTVTDESGGVLPGVTVTISSPALQTPEMTSVTDSQGRYRFTALPAGVYGADFALSGFRPLKREGLRLSVGFIANVDVQLTIGQIEDAITVSGQSPTVDVRTTAPSTLISKDLIQAIPSSGTVMETVKLAPGVRLGSTPDVGGATVGDNATFRNYGSLRGGMRPLLDGVDVHYVTTVTAYLDTAALEEVQVKALGNDSEVGAPGVVLVSVIKSGGNKFSGRAQGFWEPKAIQSDNLDDDLRRLGVTAAQKLDGYRDVGGDLGGRIIRDRLWFYGALHEQKVTRGVTGYSKSAGADGVYGTADDEMGNKLTTLAQQTIKFTGQITSKFGMNGFYQGMEKQIPELAGSFFVPFEATSVYRVPTPAFKVEATYVPTPNSFANFLVGNYRTKVVTEVHTDNSSTYDITTQQSRGVSVNSGGDGNRASSPAVGSPDPQDRGKYRWQYTGSYTYFKPQWGKGDHDMKFGGEFTTDQYYGKIPLRASGTGGAGNEFRAIFDNGVPNQVVVWNAPISSVQDLRGLTFYARDNWRLNSRLTLSLGVRSENYKLFLPPQSKEPGTFTALFPATTTSFSRKDLYSWSQVVPRAAVSYALTKDGKTAAKFSYGRYYFVIDPADGRAFNENDISSRTYRWTDLNNNRRFDGVPELGAFLSATGGTAAVVNTDLIRPKTDEVSTTVERELMADLSVRTSYVYKRESDLYQSVNVLRPFSAYTIPITQPDPGRDGVAGNADDPGRNITYYDFSPAYAGAAFVQNMNVNTDGYVNRYHSVEVAGTKRLSKNWQMQISYMATRINEFPNGVPQDPNAAHNAKLEAWETLFKVSGSYMFPFGIQASGFFDSSNGSYYSRSVVFRNGLAQQASVTVLAEPRTANQLDPVRLMNLRAEKIFRVKGNTVSLRADVYNAFNTNAVLATNTQSGASYGRVTNLIPPRIAGFGVKYTF
jgi:hypothetical protein